MSDELMTQAELDALLSEHLGQVESNPEDHNVDEYLSVEEQDILAEIGNISMGSAATALSTLVNRKVRITVPSVYVSTPVAVADSYPVPCIVVNVGYVQGLQGANILVMREEDALVIGNLMMGEDGTNLPDTLDELYLSAVTEAMNMMMGSASTSMSELFGRAIDISPPNTTRRDLSQDTLTDQMSEGDPVVTVAFRMEIEDLVDSTILQIIDIDFAKEMARALVPPEVPQPAVKTDWADLRQQPVQAQEVSPVAGFQGSAPSPYDLGNINVDLIRDIPVQVRAILGRTRMSIDNILRLGPGHIMELESLHGEPIELFANDTLIARGEVVVVGEQFGVRITEIATPQDRIVSVR
ncbi:MAG: flagellar motor switch phosphatase FliY [Firmicutes bacterium]|nr:flagellar motor switch phosphatase FliY [Bacillota bacterium]